jgi:hypothetical protein
MSMHVVHMIKKGSPACAMCLSLVKLTLTSWLLDTNPRSYPRIPSTLPYNRSRKIEGMQRNKGDEIK